MSDDDSEAPYAPSPAESCVAHSRRYLEHRAAFRERAVEAFEKNHVKGCVILEAAGELVSAHTLFLSNRDLRVHRDGPHIGSLIVSYCRTHFIAADLVRQAELIEATVLARKQMELLSRLRELEVRTQEELEGRTPNVRHLRTQARKLYAEYSAIAHSAKEEPLALLGSRLVGEKSFSVLYPECDHNAFAAAHTLGLLALDFSIYAQEFCSRVGPATDLPETGLAFQVLLQAVSE